jgi:hypothetical protein
VQPNRRRARIAQGIRALRSPNAQLTVYVDLASAFQDWDGAAVGRARPLLAALGQAVLGEQAGDVKREVFASLSTSRATLAGRRCQPAEA